MPPVLVHLALSFTPDWVVGSASFLASTVEFVEAFTIVLVVGITINWRSSLLGALLAALALAAIVALLGVSLVKFVPLSALRLVVGVILVMFGLKWLKKAVLRYSGRKALHDEEAIYEEEMAALKASGQVVPQKLSPFGVVTSFKSVLLEGLEVAFIVITFGATGSSHAIANSAQAANSYVSAIIGAALALVLVASVGAAVQAPLTRVPENTLKFVVGIMLTSFGTFWGGEGLGVNWPWSDVTLLPIIGLYLLATFIAVQALRPAKPAETASVAKS
jgi:uncharacterized membrane protein